MKTVISILLLVVSTSIVYTGCTKKEDLDTISDLGDVTNDVAINAYDATQNAFSSVVEVTKEVVEGVYDAPAETVTLVVEEAQEPARQTVDATNGSDGSTADGVSHADEATKEVPMDANDATEEADGYVTGKPPKLTDQSDEEGQDSNSSLAAADDDADKAMVRAVDGPKTISGKELESESQEAKWYKYVLFFMILSIIGVGSWLFFPRRTGSVSPDISPSGLPKCPRCGQEHAPGDTICKNPACKTQF